MKIITLDFTGCTETDVISERIMDDLFDIPGADKVEIIIDGLDLTQIETQETILFFMEKLHDNVKSICLKNCKLNIEWSAQFFSALSFWLEKVELSSCQFLLEADYESTIPLIKLVSVLPISLRKLILCDLHLEQLSENELEEALRIHQVYELQQLDLSDNHLSLEKILLFFKAFPFLRDINLGVTNPVGDEKQKLLKNVSDFNKLLSAMPNDTAMLILKNIDLSLMKDHLDACLHHFVLMRNLNYIDFTGCHLDELSDNQLLKLLSMLFLRKMNMKIIVDESILKRVSAIIAVNSEKEESLSALIHEKLCEGNLSCHRLNVRAERRVEHLIAMKC